MILFRHELRQGWRSLILWTTAIAGFMALISLLFPQVKDQMASINGLISTMGAFSDAFGLGKLNMGTFIGFYTVEYQSVLGLGGALYAAILASNSLAKEEQAGTAEFLLTHPLSRASIVTSKALALVSQLLILNAVTLAVVLLSLTLMGESAPMGQLLLLHLAYLILHLEFIALCLSLSALSGKRRGTGLGAGIGLVLGFYLANLVANIAPGLGGLKWLTPFAYVDGAEIIPNGSLTLGYVGVGLVLSACSLGVAYWWFGRKDVG